MTQQQDPVATLEALKRLIPVVAATVIALTSYFNLQAQISELRTRSTIQDVSLTGTLLELKQDIKDLKRSANYEENARRSNTVKRNPSEP